MVALIKLPDPIHIPTLIANLISAEVATDLFPSAAAGLPHPCVIHFLLHVLTSSFLQCMVSVMRMNFIGRVSAGVGMNMVVRWWVCVLGFPGTGRASVVGLRLGGEAVTRVVYHLHALSRHHAHHVVAGRQARGHRFTLDMRTQVLVSYNRLRVFRRPLPPPFGAAWVNLTLFSEVHPQVVAIGTNELVGILVVHPLDGRSGRFFGLSRIKAIGGNGGTKDLILGYKPQHSSLGQRQDHHWVCLCPNIHLLVHGFSITSNQLLGLLLLPHRHTIKYLRVNKSDSHLDFKIC